jgi:non-ribosomal peptide synthetase-like protein
LPLVPLALIMAWFALLGIAENAVSFPVLVLAVIPALDLMFLAGEALLAAALKWLLLGRVRPGTHPLWSSWSCRWDFNYTAWHYLAQDAMSMLEGTIWVNGYLRLLGVKIGRNVVVYDVFSFCIDPDMLEIGDDATVNCLYQAHTFEDRVLKIGRIKIGNRATVGSGAVLLYDTNIGDDAHVEAHSVVMKGETLEPGQTYAGVPTRKVSRN